MNKREELEQKCEMYTNRIRFHESSIEYLRKRREETASKLRRLSLDEIKKDFPYLDA